MDNPLANRLDSLKGRAGWGRTPSDQLHAPLNGSEHFRLIDLGVLPEEVVQDTRNQDLLRHDSIVFDQVWPGQNPWGLEGAVLFNHWSGPDCQWFLRLSDGTIQPVRVSR